MYAVQKCAAIPKNRCEKCIGPVMHEQMPAYTVYIGKTGERILLQRTVKRMHFFKKILIILLRKCEDAARHSPAAFFLLTFFSELKFYTHLDYRICC